MIVWACSIHCPCCSIYCHNNITFSPPLPVFMDEFYIYTRYYTLTTLLWHRLNQKTWRRLSLVDIDEPIVLGLCLKNSSQKKTLSSFLISENLKSSFLVSGLLVKPSFCGKTIWILMIIQWQIFWPQFVCNAVNKVNGSDHQMVVYPWPRTRISGTIVWNLNRLTLSGFTSLQVWMRFLLMLYLVTELAAKKLSSNFQVPL